MTRHSRNARSDLFEQLQPFCAEAIFEHAKAGEVAAGPRQALDKAVANRIGDEHEHDRHSAGRLLQWNHGRSATGQDDVRCQGDQFRCISTTTLWITSGPAIVDVNVAPYGPAKFLEPL